MIAFNLVIGFYDYNYVIFFATNKLVMMSFCVNRIIR